ncbi:hypothetical protein UYSO10_3893 [Kosakonia radicincitans]|nr:hypothetical protein UYSO10_3893 [Kosakonia radicincitans]
MLQLTSYLKQYFSGQYKEEINSTEHSLLTGKRANADRC